MRAIGFVLVCFAAVLLAHSSEPWLSSFGVIFCAGASFMAGVSHGREGVEPNPDETAELLVTLAASDFVMGLESPDYARAFGGEERLRAELIKRVKEWEEISDGKT